MLVFNCEQRLNRGLMGCAILCKPGCHAENMPQIPCIGDTDMQGHMGTHVIYWNKNQVTGITNVAV